MKGHESTLVFCDFTNITRVRAIVLIAMMIIYTTHADRDDHADYDEVYDTWVRRMMMTRTRQISTIQRRMSWHFLHFFQFGLGRGDDVHHRVLMLIISFCTFLPCDSVDHIVFWCWCWLCLGTFTFLPVGRPWLWPQDQDHLKDDTDDIWYWIAFTKCRHKILMGMNSLTANIRSFTIRWSPASFNYLVLSEHCSPARSKKCQFFVCSRLFHLSTLFHLHNDQI